MSLDGHLMPPPVAEIMIHDDLLGARRAGDYSDEDILRMTIRALAPNTIAPFRSTGAMRSWLDDPETLQDVT